MPGNADVMVCLTKTMEVWLLNTSGADITLTSCELFGFGLGACTESPTGTKQLLEYELLIVFNLFVCFTCVLCESAGTARTQAGTSWPWLIEHDKTLVILVSDGQKKAPMNVAEVCYHAAQKLGVTSLNLVEHQMEQKVEE